MGDTDTQRNEMFQWLSAADNDARHRDVQRKRCENTGAWFLQRDAFTAWLDPAAPPGLWCKGMRTDNCLNPSY